MNALVEFTQKLENSTDLVHDEKGALLPPDTLYEWLEAAKHISKMCKEYEAQLKEAVQKSGPLQLETLPELAIAIVESDGRTSINAEKAMPVLYDYFEPSEVAPFVTIQKGKMEKALMDKTGHAAIQARTSRSNREREAITPTASNSKKVNNEWQDCCT